MREAYAQSLVYGFGDFATIQKKQTSLSDHVLYSPWGSKNRISSKNSSK